MKDIVCSIPVKPYSAEFNEFEDVSEVVCTSSNLRVAYANGSIPPNLGVDEHRFNGIEDPASILSSPKDVFEAAQLRQTISDYEPSKPVE